MAVQVPLLVALALFMSAEAINAGDPAALPSQKAAVVLPLLREFSPKETSKGNVLEKITKILGKDFLTTAHGPNGAVEELFYELDDRTIIHVGFLDGKLAGITREVSSRVVEILYPASNRSYWIWPFVRASACEPDGSVLVTWWDEKGNFHRYVDAKYVGTGYLGLRDQGDVVEGINADWKITLSPSPDNDDGLEQATADSRIFLAESTLDRDQTFVNVYVNGGLTGTLGPFLRYRRWPVAVESNYNFSSDGNDCTSLLIWKDKTKTTPQVLVIDGNGAI
ncbi:MAG TPA: hypothetical protein VL981_08290, partial [Candidatus Methylacidiphilales bacterium]|nr:hypothetical protein [Candidatus Methylacidiphilales bacterium]